MEYSHKSARGAATPEIFTRTYAGGKRGERPIGKAAVHREAERWRSPLRGAAPVCPGRRLRHCRCGRRRSWGQERGGRPERARGHEKGGTKGVPFEQAIQ